MTDEVEPDVLWTGFSPHKIADEVAAMGTPVCPHVMRDGLEEQGLASHKIEKSLEGGESPDRNTQFLRIAGLPTYAAVTSRSYHTGAVNSLLMDGSVRTISANLNLATWRNLGARADGNVLGEF